MLAALILVLLINYNFDQSQNTATAPFTESVVEVWDGPEGMSFKLIKVPSRSGKVAYICFKIAKHKVIQCLYLENETGIVEQIPILPLKKDQ